MKQLMYKSIVKTSWSLSSSELAQKNSINFDIFQIKFESDPCKKKVFTLYRMSYFNFLRYISSKKMSSRFWEY